MKHKIIGYIIGVVFLLGGFMIMKKMISGKKQPAKKEVAPSVKFVQTINVNLADTPIKVPINGKLESFNKVELYSEVGGTER